MNTIDIDVYDKLFNKVCGSHMRSARKAMGLSQEEVSVKTGIKYARYYTYEAGSRTCSVGVLNQFCSALGIDFLKFFEGIIKEVNSK